MKSRMPMLKVWVLGLGLGGLVATSHKAHAKPKEDADAPAEKKAPIVAEQPGKTFNGNTLFANEANELWRCVYKVAAQQRVAPAKVKVGRTLVRLTVSPKGEAKDVAVVAVEPTDPDLLVCVKNEVERWRAKTAPANDLHIETEVSLLPPQARTATASE